MLVFALLSIMAMRDYCNLFSPAEFGRIIGGPGT